MKYKNEIIKNKKMIAVIMISSFVLALLFAIKNQNSNHKEYSEIVRPKPGESAITKNMIVYGQDGEEISRIETEIPARVMSEDEVFKHFEDNYNQVLLDMLGDNEDLSSVRNNLYLPEKSRDNIVLYEWYSGDYTLISYDGRVNNEFFKESDFKDTYLRLIMRYENYKTEYIFNLTIRAPYRNEKQLKEVQIKSEISKAIQNNQSNDTVELPTVVGGEKITYQEEKDETNPLLFILFGMILCVVLVIGEKKKKEDATSNRKKKLVLDYSEIVSKLTILLGAGMTVRMAWKKIARDYKEKNKLGLIPTKLAYEEMYETLCNLEAGISEPVAYLQFGRRCDTKEYLKLASLLQTNIKKGTRELRSLMEAETKDAFEQRKARAKIKGEEASTKLLFPMMLMLMTVMLIVMVPAIMTFNF